MTENLQKAYDAYQQALVNLRDPKVSDCTPGGVFVLLATC